MRRFVGVTAVSVASVFGFVASVVGPLVTRAEAAAVGSPTVPAQQPGPPRSVPGIASATGFRVRTSPGGGTYQYVAPVSLPAGAVPFYGDWNGDGAATPGFFLAGRWTLYDSFVGTPTPVAVFTFGAPG